MCMFTTIFEEHYQVKIITAYSTARCTVENDIILVPHVYVAMSLVDRQGTAYLPLGSFPSSRNRAQI